MSGVEIGVDYSKRKMFRIWIASRNELDEAEAKRMLDSSVDRFEFAKSIGYVIENGNHGVSNTTDAEIRNLSRKVDELEKEIHALKHERQL